MELREDEPSSQFGEFGAGFRFQEMALRLRFVDHRKFTVARPVETPPRPGFYTLLSHNKNGHVEAPEARACSATTGSGSISLYIPLKARRQAGYLQA